MATLFSALLILPGIVLLLPSPWNDNVTKHPRAASPTTDLGCRDVDYLSVGVVRSTQRKPMWLMPVSIIWGRRAAGR